MFQSSVIFGILTGSKLLGIEILKQANSRGKIKRVSICDSQENDRHQRSLLYKVSKATGRLRGSLENPGSFWTVLCNLTGQVMGQRQENGPHLEEQHETKQGHLAVGEPDYTTEITPRLPAAAESPLILSPWAVGGSDSLIADR
uniref:Uncharacterized protein n=1 Tax=Magallana gigas TaxID=29159 RepID=K1RAJ2_MAGGI